MEQKSCDIHYSSLLGRAGGTVLPLRTEKTSAVKENVRFAVLADDAAAIAKAPGIGKKTAQKLILELKDKLDLEDAFEQKLANQSAAGIPETEGDNQLQEAVQALVALGYPNTDALRAVKKVEGAETMDVETLLKAALKKMI